ncbi:MAG: amidohydrolase [Thermoleophilaceae bacterium]|nr:amidohydrolase [Thermoleophilaceae bacterium]
MNRDGTVALCVDGALVDGERVGLRAARGEIAELGPDVAPREGDRVIEGRGFAVVPGLVNAHTHAAMTLFRGYADDLPLMEWLEQHIWPAEARLEADDVYWGTRLACAEMIRTGTTRFLDMYWHPEATARAVLDAGLRGVIGTPLIDLGDPERAGRVRAAALESTAQVEDLANERIEPSLTPHAIYTVSEQSLRWVAEQSATRDLIVQIHLSETAREVDDCLAAHGVRPAQYLDRVGLLGERTVLAHCVHVDDSELDLIAERGATIATNPAANMKLAVGGAFPYAAANARNVRLGLGTDGPGSNNSLDLLADAKLFALLQKHASADAAAAPAHEVWRLATGARSPLLAGRDMLAVGIPADFLLVRTDSPELSLGDLEAGLIYAASGSVVDTTVVGGQVLMSGGIVEGEAEVVAMARERAARLGLA